MEVNTDACRILVVKPEGRKLLERPRRILENNIKINLKIVGCAGMDWIDLAQDSDQWRVLVKTLMNLRFP
jgi:hypothetical protein